MVTGAAVEKHKGPFCKMQSPTGCSPATLTIFWVANNPGMHWNPISFCFWYVWYFLLCRHYKSSPSRATVEQQQATVFVSLWATLISHVKSICCFRHKKIRFFFHSASVKWVDLFIIPLTNRIVSQNVWPVKLLMDKDSWPVNFLHRIYSCKCQTLVSYHESFLECSFPLHVYHHVPSIHCRLLYIV